MSPLTCFVEHGTREEFSTTRSSLTPFGPCLQLGPHWSSTPKILQSANWFPALLPSRLFCLSPYSSFFHFLTYFRGWGSLAIAMSKVGILVLVSEFCWIINLILLIFIWFFSYSCKLLSNLKRLCLLGFQELFYIGITWELFEM
jgi:hypothetical protein